MLDLKSALARVGMTFEGRDYQYNPVPTLIGRGDAEAICGDAKVLADALQSIGEQYATDPQIRGFFASYKSLEPIALIDVPYRPMAYLNRFDTVWNGGDRFQVLETNSCCPAGVTSNALTRRAWQETTAFQGLLEGYRIFDYPIDSDMTFASSLKSLLDNAPPGVIALANYNGNYTFELDHIAHSLRTLGCEVQIADITEFEYANGRLTLDGRPVAVVYNKLDQLAFRAGFNHLDYFRAYADGAFVCVNSFRAQIILEDKGVLALMTAPEFQYAFEDVHKSAIRDHVPWTAYVRDAPIWHPYEGRIDMLAYLRARKDELVLKPSNQTRGAGVMLGRHTDRERWDAAVRAALGGEWIVQQYVELPTACAVHVKKNGAMTLDNWQFSLDLYFLGGTAIGLASRSNHGDVINVGSGGMRHPLCVVEPERSPVSLW